ncbi:MAG: 2-oxoglutarate and iron-dependent oxygenase domain-containing protein [Pseudomonadota bacterium]
MTDIPVIDIAPLRDGTGASDVAKALHAASTGPGFIYVTGHGIDEALIDEARQTALTFFRQPDTAKAEVAVTGNHRGWLGTGRAVMADDVKPDLKESFVWGYQTAAGDTPDDHPLRGANKWPAAPAMEPVCTAYFAAANDVALHLMRGFALGLGLAPDAFLKTADRPISRCSFVYYPPQPAEAGAGQFGVGPHTDFGVLTVLCQDGNGGLEVETPDGRWIAAPPIPGTLVVNVGDLLGRWTDGIYRSTPHRVINRSGRERLSLVLAYDPNPETMIDARDILGAGHTPKAPPITCGDYLTWRFGKAFGGKAAK